MKKVPTVVKIIPVSVFILYSLFASSENTLKTLLPFDYYAPLGYLQDQLQWILTPSMERNRIMKVPEAYMSVVEIITQRGYPVEVHHVTTEDGYVLELHRIPFGSKGAEINSTRTRRPVFLQHGLAGSDHHFLISATNNSLPFGLAERGYDVWMGNSRGNLFSRKHVKLDPDKDEEFWNYSWDEMARYDLPASIDYVLNVTRQRKLAAYFGYSLGCTLFFMHSSESSRLSEQVDVMVGLGPTASVANLGNYFKPMSAFVKLYQLYQRWFGIGEVHANNGLLHTLTRLILDTSYIGEAIVRMWVLQIYGSSEDMQRSDLYRLSSHYPAGASANSMVHLMQNYNSGESMDYFDYGKTENLIRYGTAHPPEYNLTRVMTPVLLIHADNDPFAPPEDVAWLKNKLGNLVGSIRVPVPTFSHGDFIWSSRASELVYGPAMDFLPSPYLDERASKNVIL